MNDRWEDWGNFFKRRIGRVSNGMSQPKFDSIDVYAEALQRISRCYQEMFTVIGVTGWDGR